MSNVIDITGLPSCGATSASQSFVTILRGSTETVTTGTTVTASQTLTASGTSGTASPSTTSNPEKRSNTIQPALALGISLPALLIAMLKCFGFQRARKNRQFGLGNPRSTMSSAQCAMPLNFRFFVSTHTRPEVSAPRSKSVLAK